MHCKRTPGTYTTLKMFNASAHSVPVVQQCCKLLTVSAVAGLWDVCQNCQIHKIQSILASQGCLRQVYIEALESLYIFMLSLTPFMDEVYLPSILYFTISLTVHLVTLTVRALRISTYPEKDTAINHVRK